MTQAQIAQWLGVTIKQVKYLEHHRRNPSGPTRRLLSILARELKFGDPPPVQVLGASSAKKPAPKPVAPRAEPRLSSSIPLQNAPVAVAPVVQVVEAPRPVDEPSPAQPDADQPPDDGAFTWQ
ncbi:MAG TPA: hypothetical protein VL486_03045 [Verrucomicrobiae bacterium]|nr:hypothetical protein [Verrucomicrobiae bacterium]